MAGYERFPSAGPVRFIPANDSLKQDYNNWPFNRGFFQEQILSFQLEAGYEQKWQYNDKILLYLDTLAPDIVIYAIDEDGTELWNTSPVGTDFDGNLAPSGDPYHTFAYTFVPGTVFDPDTQRVVYFVIKCRYDAGDKYYVSEPQFLRRKWDDTFYIEARHDSNDYDVQFDAGYVLRQRVEGSVRPIEINANDVLFEDQQRVSVQLDASPIIVSELQIGGEEGVPFYIKDKVSRLLVLNNVAIDGDGYTKNTGAKWSNTGTDTYPLWVAKMELQFADPNAGTTFYSEDPPVLLEFAMDEDGIIFPCTFNYLRMNDAVHTVEDLQPVVFEDQDDLDAFVSELNGDFLTDNALAGEFALTDGRLTYVNAEGESYGPSPGMETYHHYFPFSWLSQNPTYGPSTFQFYMKSAAAGLIAKIVVDWGEFYITTENVVNYYSAGNTLTLFGHTREYNTFKTIARFFHAGPTSRIDVLEFPATSLGLTFITKWGGTGYYDPAIGSTEYVKAPGYLTQFSVTNQAMGSSGNDPLDFSFLTGCANSLRVLRLAHDVLNYTGIDVIKITPVLLNYDDVDFNALVSINISNNYFSAADLADFILDGLRDHRTNMAPVVVNIKQLVPAIVVDADALDYIADTTSLGWTWLRDT